ncbi:MAG: PASTA domain-containing protein, partial [Nocardioidaceae bacterium]
MTVASTTFIVTPRRVTVPALGGMTVEAAESTLKTADLRLAGTLDGQGRVADQRPVAGTEVPPGTEVTVTLEDPPVEPERVRVPTLRGKTVQAARAALDAIKLTLGGDVGGDGLIVDQQPAPDTLVPLGTVVTVTLPAPPPRVPVPALHNLTVESARATVAAAGLALGTTANKGRVVGQQPAPDTLVPVGTLVTITVTDPPPARWAVVPELYDLTVESARDTLAAAGLKLGSAVLEAGRVVDQRPAANTLAPLGSTVTVTFSGVTLSGISPPSVLVPTLSGMSVNAARTTVRAARLTLAGHVVDKGRVVDQRPAAGTEVVIGTPIAVTLRPSPDRRWL